MITEPSELLRPTYTTYRFTEQIYKIIHFKRSPFVVPGVQHEQHETYDHKIDASISRSKRMILEYALCNPWSYFVTLTLDKTKYDRNDLDSFKKDLSQFVRDQRKKWSFPIAYLFVPEQHKDGAWHMHGLLNLPDAAVVSFSELRLKGQRVPQNLIDGKFLNWSDFQRRFGFCSLGSIRDPVACAFYVTKYIEKAIDDSSIQLGKHLYLPSRNLQRATKWGDIYCDSSYLDKFTTKHYDFVDVGMTKVSDKLDWTFAGDLIDAEPFDLTCELEHIQEEIALIEALEQLSFT